MTDIKAVAGSHRTSIGPQHRAASPAAGQVRGVGVLAAVCGGLFGGRARVDSAVLVYLSQQPQAPGAMAYQEAA